MIRRTPTRPAGDDGLQSDFEWIRASGVATFDELDDLAPARRAPQLGPERRREAARDPVSSLSRWVHRRKIPA